MSEPSGFVQNSRSHFSLEWEDSFFSLNPVHFSHDGRVIWGIQKLNGQETCTAVDSFNGTETLPFTDHECFLNYVPITNTRGCLVRCISQVGLRISVVDVNLKVGTFEPTNLHHDLKLQQLTHIPRFMTFGQFLAFEITSINVTSGQDEVPILFVFQVPIVQSSQFTSKDPIPLVYGNATAIYADNSRICYFPRDFNFSNLVTINLVDGLTTITSTNDFPFTSDEIKQFGSNVVWHNESCYFVVGSTVAVLDLKMNNNWNTINLVPTILLDKVHRPVIYLNSEGILNVHVHKEGSKHRKRTYCFQINHPESLKNLSFFSLTRNCLLKLSDLPRNSQLQPLFGKSIVQLNTSKYVPRFRMFSK
ncbi:hypothetical protein M3Y96_00246500 [Aphelenchoides besseyi]|nr:hypothetical protein M3Y96_00246500 [Aphelenchoides besseyi]